MRVGIIGLGLIGGSIGLALKKSLFASHVIGYDANKEHSKWSCQNGIIDQEATAIEDLVQASELVILAVPVQEIAELLSDVLDSVDHQMVIDVGSTKAEIIERVRGHANRGRFLATHPMAGTEFSGPQAAESTLFDGKVCVFCDREDSDQEVVLKVEELYKSIGMNIVDYNSLDHDIHTAYVSHISHISSFALALTVLEKEKNENRIFELASGGFSSTVRLAKSNPDTWIPIFQQNRDNVLDVLDEHINVISQFRTLLIKKDFDTFYSLIERANDITKILK